MIRVLLVLLLTVPVIAVGQVSKKMDDLFGSMSNTSRPGIVEGQTRGVITGGSAQARFGSAGIQVVGFTPPSIKAGCGGLDAYGGSFSFVNKEEFVNFGRKVAANAAGYMFHLALSALCDTCQARMAELQAKVEKWNQYFQNSCETAQLLVDKSGAGAQATALGHSARSMLRKKGAGDNLETAHQGPGEESEAAALAQAAPEEAQKLIPGNVLIKALRKASADAWFGGGDEDALYEDIMSLTGTVVVCVPGVDGCRAPEYDTSERSKEPTAFPVAPTVSFRDLVYGSNYGGNQGTDAVQFLRCNNSECVAPVPEGRPGFKGMATRIIELMSGTDREAGPNAGLIGKLSRGIGAFNAAEIGFMTGAGIYTSKALRLARRSEVAAHQFVEVFAPELAAEMLGDFVAKVTRWTELAVDINGHDATGQMRERLAAVRADMRAEHRQIAQSLAGHAQLMAYYDTLLRSIDPPTLPTRAITVAGSE